MLAGRAKKPEGPVIIEQNRHAVLVFLRLQTQWDRGGMGGERSGLNYSRIGYVVERMGLSAREDTIFAQLQIMEYAALEEFSAQAKAREQNRKSKRGR